MNKRLNEYSLQVYRAVCLVIVLCYVWCSACSGSEDVGVYRDAHAIQQANRIVDMIVPLLNLHIIHEKRIALIKEHNLIQYTAKAKEQEGSKQLSLSRIIRGCFGPIMMLYKRITNRSPSLIVREVLIQKSASIIVQKPLDYLKSCINGENIDNENLTQMSEIVTLVKRLNAIKTDLLILETQLQANKLKRIPAYLEEEIATIETKLIKLAERYDSKALNKRGKEAKKEEEELEQLSKKGDHTTLTELLLKSDKEIEKRVSNDEMAMLDKAKAIIDGTATEADEVITGSRPTIIGMLYRMICRMLTQPNRHKEMKARKAIDPKFINSQPSILPARLNTSQTNKPDINNTLHLKDSTIYSISTFYKTNHCLSPIPRALIFDQEPKPIEEQMSFFDKRELKLPELNQKDCTLKLDSEQETLLRKFISGGVKYVLEEETHPVWRMFDINRANQSNKYGLSGTGPEDDYSVFLDLDWKENELMKLLDVLKKFSQITLDADRVEILNPRGPAGLLVLAQLLTLFETPGSNATKSPFKLTITLEYTPCPFSVLSFNDVDLQSQFRDQIEKIEESRYIVELFLDNLTSDIQKFIWPLVTHLSITKLGLVRPLMDKIDFLNDVNWRDRFTLMLNLDYQKDSIVSLGGRTAKGKDLPTCAYLFVHTNFPNQHKKRTNCPRVYVLNLDGYLQPHSSDKKDKLLTTSVSLTVDVLLSYAFFGLKQSVTVQTVNIGGIPSNYTINDIVFLRQQLIKFYDQPIKFYQHLVEFSSQSINLYQQLLENDKQLANFYQQLTQFNNQLTALYKPSSNLNLLITPNPGKGLFNFSITARNLYWTIPKDSTKRQAPEPFSNLIIIDPTIPRSKPKPRPRIS
ncbi:hypothetical protein NEHOM01_1351 [Nematocida homosporus]|uniref:uncharacterized protein n=1 Tax=Nematocida homosporus TaxID=1912981 RepID=UPI00221E6B81|nr:uncharacterized protein NEHOM01_1351 [Nematocida homosporus]KAI5186262.1 hypothetical protein NEHOM01_1351 [Nematocida homosporus]